MESKIVPVVAPGKSVLVKHPEKPVGRLHLGPGQSVKGYGLTEANIDKMRADGFVVDETRYAGLDKSLTRSLTDPQANQKRDVPVRQWTSNPADLQGLSLDTLKIMILEIDDRYPVDRIELVDQAVEVLCADYNPALDDVELEQGEDVRITSMSEQAPPDEEQE